MQVLREMSLNLADRENKINAKLPCFTRKPEAPKKGMGGLFLAERCPELQRESSGGSLVNRTPSVSCQSRNVTWDNCGMQVSTRIVSRVHSQCRFCCLAHSQIRNSVVVVGGNDGMGQDD